MLNKSISDIPESMCNVLPAPDRKISMAVYSNAWQNYASLTKRKAAATCEETSAKVAWAAVKKLFKKDEKTSKWEGK